MSRNIFGIAKKIFKYLFLAFFILIIILFFALINKASAVKNYYHNVLSGKEYLEQSVESFQGQKYAAAKEKADLANAQFDLALNNLENIRENKVINYLSPLSVSVSDLEYLTQTAQILSRSLSRGTNILIELSNLTDGRFTNTFSDLSTTDRQNILSTIYQSAPEINGLRANLLLSLNNLDKIKRIGILLPVKSQLDNIKGQLQTAYNLLEQLSPLAQLIPALSGYPQENTFLLVLQNNDELRPTGGFIGTYGLMTMKDGKPSDIITEDVYHLDMPCIGKLKLTPPEPIAKYMGVEYWWLRDANFSPDFPSSAKQIEEMFYTESGCADKAQIRPTAVIALNPDLIADLIELVGPITVEGETYDYNNFQELLQYNVEVAYLDKNISSWDRKEVINSVIKELEKRLMKLPTKELTSLLKIVQENISKRNLQIYFSDAKYQSIAKDLNITGEIKHVDNDYLMVVDANLAAFKSDAVVQKNISYEISGQNPLLAKVKLNYRHEGGFDWRTTRYRSYTRIYAPLGSQLVSKDELEDFSVYNDKDLQKTVFAFFWSIEPGTEETISLTYSLPERINQGNYRLYFQKQSGSRLNNFVFTKNINGEEELLWQTSLDRDKLFQ